VLHAAVLDPNDPRVLDDLRFATGCRITPYVLPEIWMHDWLLALFKVPRGIRHIETDAGPDQDPGEVRQGFDFEAAQAAMAAKSARGAAASAASAAAATAAGVSSPAASAALQFPLPPPVPGGAPKAPAVQRPSIPREQGFVISDAAFSVAGGAAPPGASVRPPPMPVRSLADLVGAASRVTLDALAPQPIPDLAPDLSSVWDDDRMSDARAAAPSDGPDITIEPQAEPSLDSAPAAAKLRELYELEGDLAQAGDREQLIDVTFSIATRLAPTVALFIVHKGMVQGARCVARGEPRAIDGVLVPLEAASMLTQAVNAVQALAEQMGAAYGQLILSKKGAGAA
jgi:hypothetical protein